MRPADVPAPILCRDVGRRLDAIIRRHGGTPKPDPAPTRMHLPTPRWRRPGPGQLEFQLQLGDAH